MTARELRQKYLSFFAAKGHTVFPSGSLVPYDVTGRLDESLLFNGAGMVQFKPYFRGVAVPPNPRLATAQKCVRTGDIESVGNLSHLTFFEMLGNFSFGDYFKQDAIAYSWEFLTSPDWLALDPRRLSFTVFEEDDETFGYWARHLEEAGISPENRIFRLGEETNYWPAGAFSHGPPGPCGPNSEMFYWTSNEVPPPPSRTADGEYSRDQWLADDEAKNWLEIWNDVFIQYEWQGEPRNPDRPADGFRKLGMPELPFRSIDTGMGLERTTAVLNGLASVYDTDLFAPILERLGAIAESYGSDWSYGTDEARDRAARIIADHLRTASFCIADGVRPGSSGRGYVLRRLIRRAVLKGLRTLGFGRPFLPDAYSGVADALADHYTELLDRRDTILETLRAEEELFRRTIARGMDLLEDELRSFGPGEKVLGGAAAFRLYDTFGFPLEVTQELCSEAGVEVDVEGYEVALREAQERSRAGSGMESVYGGVGIVFAFEFQEGPGTTPTAFLGYESTVADARIVGALEVRDSEGRPTGEFAVALDRTPFYAESGGQVSDVGQIHGDGLSLEVLDVARQDGVIVHLCRAAGPDRPDPAELFGRPVRAEVDGSRRRAITRNHTATHLLHAALRTVLGGHVAQAGSLVGPDHLRFDFAHGKAMSGAEVEEVEQLVYGQVLSAQPVRTYEDVPLEEARRMGAIALFGEKYAERVRVVQVGGMPPEEPSFSRELCGGVHVRNTGEIGLFKILSESSAASGVRRIEAVTGEGAYRWASGQAELVRSAAERLKSAPQDLLSAIDKLTESVREERRKVEKLRAATAQPAEAEAADLGAAELVVQRVDDLDGKEATLIADRLADGRPRRVVLVAAVADGKVSLIAKAGAEAVSAGAHAGNLAKALAQRLGGGGGGRPDFATAGGRDLAGLDAALESAEALVRQQLGG